MTALTRLLPAGRGTLSKDAYLAVSDFVLDNGELTEEERARLIAAVHAVSAESSGGRPGLKDVPGVGELATRGSTGS